MAHIYAIVVTDERELGFDSFVELMEERLTTGDVGVNWLSNPLIPSERSDDFHAVVLAHGTVLDALDAEDKPRTRMEHLRAGVQDADSILRSLRDRVEGTGLSVGLDDALDRWDAWAAEITDPDDDETGSEEAEPAGGGRCRTMGGHVDHELVERGRRALAALGVKRLSTSARTSPVLLIDVLNDSSVRRLGLSVNSAHPDRCAALRSLHYDGVNVLPVLLVDLGRREGSVTILHYDPVCGVSEAAALNLLADPERDSPGLAAGLEDDIREALAE